MSTTSAAVSPTRTAVSSARSHRAVEDASGPRDLFDDLIWHSDEICSHCFQRIRKVDELDTNRWGSGNQPGETRQRVGAGTVGYDSEAHDGYGAQESFTSATTCGECGRIHGRADDDTMSKQRALDKLPALTRRLNEQGFAVNSDVLYRAVGHLKSQPEYRGRDTEIFAIGTLLALRDAG